MNDRMEILVTTRDRESKSVPFSDLYSMRERIVSLMFLWNNNSYFIDSETSTFIVNGGRRTRFNEMLDCSIVYRRRTRREISMFGEKPLDVITWILGIESATGSKVLLQVSEDGREWSWENTL